MMNDPGKTMSKKDNRGEFAKPEGDIKGKKKIAIVSFVEGTKPNKKLPMKSLTPKAPMMKKK